MHQLKLVVVDDDDLIREAVCTLVGETLPKAEILDYFSAKKALDAVDSGTVDLLITNCHMMDMDGPTLVRNLRETKHALPIIMVSGSEDAERLGHDAGIDRFVPKNLLVTMLPDAILTLLDISGAPQKSSRQ